MARWKFRDFTVAERYSNVVLAILRITRDVVRIAGGRFVHTFPKLRKKRTNIGRNRPYFRKML